MFTLDAGGSKSECEQPVEASRDTCTMEQAKQLGKPCGRRLAKDCHAAGMGFMKEGGFHCTPLVQNILFLIVDIALI